MNIKTISCQTLKQRLDANDDIFLLDVREISEVNLCKIDGAVHIPMNMIPLYLDKIPDEKPIVVYCHHGVRSQNVITYLINNGFDEDDLYNLTGGINEWAITVDPKMARY